MIESENLLLTLCYFYSSNQHNVNHCSLPGISEFNKRYKRYKNVLLRCICASEIRHHHSGSQSRNQ